MSGCGIQYSAFLPSRWSGDPDQCVFKGVSFAVPLVRQSGIPEEAASDPVELGKVRRLRSL